MPGDSESNEGVCRWAGVQPLGADCPGCRKGRPRHHAEHTLDDRCRWAVASYREEKRTGAHPRDGRVPANNDPTTTAKSDPRLDEEEAQQQEQQQQPAGDEPGSAASTDKEPRTRNRVTTAEAGTQAATTASEWSEWDLGRALPLLRSGSPGVVRRTLRKIHIRLWHCPSARLRDLLTVAGAPPSVLDQVQSVVDTCRVCRSWQDVAPRAIASSSITAHFNEDLQVDLMFWKTHTILHMIDVCLRFAVATIIANRTTEVVLEAITKFWFRVFGPLNVSRQTTRVHWIPMRAELGLRVGEQTSPSGPTAVTLNSLSDTTHCYETNSI